MRSFLVLLAAIFPKSWQSNGLKVPEFRDWAEDRYIDCIFCIDYDNFKRISVTGCSSTNPITCRGNICFMRQHKSSVFFLYTSGCLNLTSSEYEEIAQEHMEISSEPRVVSRETLLCEWALQARRRRRLILQMIIRVALVLFLSHDTFSQADAVDMSDDDVAEDMELIPRRAYSHRSTIYDAQLSDWSDAKRTSPRYIEILLVVDAAISRYYGHKIKKVRMAMQMLMHAVNMLGIRITVVDVVPLQAHNLSLQHFLEWRQSADKLASHDLAMLIRHRYEGGISFVDGVCKSTGVGIAGYSPEAPLEYASVFFHELSHLLGLTHSAKADCRCLEKNRGNCLRISGFEECSVQALVDLLPTIQCLDEPRKLPGSCLAICGNGIIEGNEDCDCGPAKYCNNALCEPRTCRFTLPKQNLYTIVTSGIAFIICAALYLIKRTFMLTKDSKTASANEVPFRSPEKTMLNCTDSVPTEFAPYLRADNSVYPLSSNTVQRSPLERKPDRLACERQVRLTLDSSIPIVREPILSSDYVIMSPPRSMRVMQNEDDLTTLPILDDAALPCWSGSFPPGHDQEQENDSIILSL
ncbi:hypothetical protein Q1695_000995 [Nippostrongylus brasiliensis]|nr:hypothetical protein Q1695_000995 [Nippostrongylus brasiliensis]